MLFNYQIDVSIFKLDCYALPSIKWNILRIIIFFSFNQVLMFSEQPKPWWNSTNNEATHVTDQETGFRFDPFVFLKAWINFIVCTDDVITFIAQWNLFCIMTITNCKLMISWFCVGLFFWLLYLFYHFGNRWFLSAFVNHLCIEISLTLGSVAGGMNFIIHFIQLM